MSVAFRVPELPEVESVRRSVAPLIIGRTVLEARLLRRDVLVAPGDPFGGLARQRRGSRARPRPFDPADILAGATITRIERRGKQLVLIARAGEERAVGVQLGMTGGLIFVPAGAPSPRDHVHALWRFDHGSLAFRDPRRFGSLRVFCILADLESHWASLGPDALTISARALGKALADSRRAVKAVLLDQSLLAGVGNIYADEALFAARIHPARSSATLSTANVVQLSSALRAILSAAVRAGGTTLRDYADAEGRPGSFQHTHAVYGRAGLPCTSCGRPLVSATIAQRTTVWCPRCQPKSETRTRPLTFAHVGPHSSSGPRSRKSFAAQPR